MTTVINVKKIHLQKSGYKDLEDWLKCPNHVYIGREMSFYVKGAKGSKWANPYPVKKYGFKCLDLYRELILNNKELLDQINELQGKVLGCWCIEPDNNKCHGTILKEILEERMKLKK